MPWPWRREPAARQHGEVPVAVGTHLHVAAGDDGDDDDHYDDSGADDAKSTASSEHSHLTLPVEEPVHVDDDDEDDPGDEGVHAHYEVAGSGPSGSEEEPPSGSESDGESGHAGHGSRAARGHHSPRGRRRRSARVPAFMVAGTTAAVMLLVLAALVAWKRRQRAGS